MSPQSAPESDRASAMRVMRGEEIKGRWARVVRCLTLPSFAEATSWVVCLGNMSRYGHQPDGQAHFFTWREGLGEEAGRGHLTSGGKPDVEHVLIDLTAEDLGETLAPLNSISVPVLLRNTDEGLDGTTVEFAMHFGPSQVECSWWEDGPAEWVDFVGAVREVERRLDRVLKR